jgi:hypothetical protein
MWMWSISKNCLHSHNIDYNAWISDYEKFAFYGLGKDDLTYELWQNKFGYDQHSLFVRDNFLIRPGFVPHRLSPVIDKGCAFPEVTEDFRGVHRPKGTNPDIGAYELR